MIKQTLLLFFILLIYNVYSQETFSSNDIIKTQVTYQGLSNEASSKTIFKLLGLSNNIDSRKLYLVSKIKISIVIQRNNNGILNANIVATPISLEGNINIKDFVIDTLLWPAHISASLSIKNGKHTRDIIAVKLNTNGSNNYIDLSDYNNGIGEVSATVNDIGFIYNESDFIKIDRISESIKYYYSYGLLFDGFIKEYSNSAIKADMGTSNIFVQKLETDRVYNYLVFHDFFNDLNLYNRDPIKLLSKIKRFKRVIKRAETLYLNKMVNSNTIDNPTTFCNLYYGLSAKYLSFSNSLQPSESVGYEEVARIFSSKSTIQFLRTIIKYLEKNSDINTAKLVQCISDGFITQSEIKIANQDFSGALLLLSNSKLINNWFNHTPSVKYNNALLTAINGIASSYLKVGYKALKSNNIELASLYINKAEEIFRDNIEMITNIEDADTSINEFVRLQTKIAIQYAGFKMFNEAIKSLYAAELICNDHVSNNNCLYLDTISCIIHDSNLRFKLNNLENLISQFQYPDAYNYFESINSYTNSYTCINNSENERFKKLAYSLFLVFLQQGEILIDAQQYVIALENLFKAKEIQPFIKDELIDINRLINLAAEPVILEVIEEAKYDTWANRMDDARKKYSHSIDLSSSYFNNSNQKINDAIIDLKNQIDMRKCRDINNKFSDAIITANLLIKSEKYDGLIFQIEKARSYYKHYPDCNIDNSSLLNFEETNSEIINYYTEYSELRKSLYNKDYSAFIKKYDKLEKYYHTHKLIKYNIAFNPLYDFIKKQKMPALTIEASRYFIYAMQPELSLDYIKLFKEQGGNTKDFRNEISNIAKMLARNDDEQNIPSGEAIQRYTEGEAILSYFKIVYLKNRIIKTSP